MKIFLPFQYAFEQILENILASLEWVHSKWTQFNHLEPDYELGTVTPAHCRLRCAKPAQGPLAVLRVELV